MRSATFRVRSATHRRKYNEIREYLKSFEGAVSR